MLSLPDVPQDAPVITLSAMNFGVLPMITGQGRLARRFYDDAAKLNELKALLGQALDADKAMELGLITANPDDIDWADEIRLALEERASMSPDALTGMEANLRFNGQENMFTRVFGRLSAWQNWIFNRPNAVGESGALKVYGTGSKAKFEFERV
jgi:benzoyl-CoA-dihydrodiol lyase